MKIKVKKIEQTNVNKEKTGRKILLFYNRELKGNSINVKRETFHVNKSLTLMKVCEFESFNTKKHSFKIYKRS